MARTLQVRSNADDVTKGRKPESPREKFKRIAQLRVGDVVDGIELLKKLANPAVYDAGEPDFEIIVNTVQSRVDELREALRNRGKTTSLLRFPDDE